MIRPRPFVLSAMAGVLVTASSCKRDPEAEAAASPAGRSMVTPSASGMVDSDALESMRWQDIAATVETCVRHHLADTVLEKTGGSGAPPVIYLRGMLKFSRGDGQGAAAEWGRLDVEAVPADHLYAPWRLAASLGGENRYAAALDDAVASGRASSLVCARHHGLHARWKECMAAYLKTDPAAWTTHETKTFALLKLQAPHARDVTVLMAGALAGGRVPDELKVDLARLVKETPVPDKEELATVLRTDPAFAVAAERAVADGLELRQAFAADRFAEVLRRVSTKKPEESPDEVVLLAFLSGVQQGDKDVADRWADELFRRNPKEETRIWIQEIRGADH